jgi:hypothetical protein
MLFMTTSKIKYWAAGFCITLFGCSDPKIGFISDDITYSQNPFVVQQGKAVYSNAVAADGSTFPLNVKLLEIRNKATGQVATELMQAYETAIFKSQISQQDTTLELVASRVTKESFPVFKINPVGGQLQFSPQTIYVPVGEYTFDVEVWNDAGRKVIKDICTVRIVSGNAIPFLSGNAIGYKTELVEGKPVINQYTYNVGITTTRADAETNSIQFRFVDIQGDIIDPVKYGFMEGMQDTDYKFSAATPWLKGVPSSVTHEAVSYTFPVVPFPYNWIQTGRAFRFQYTPKNEVATEFRTKTGFDFFAVRINTSDFKLTYDGAYTVTVKCDFLDI